MEGKEKWELLIELLRGMQSELKLMNAAIQLSRPGPKWTGDHVFLSFKGSEIYLLHKAFLDAGGAPHENLRTLLEKTVASLANKTQRGFSVDSVYKCSDKVCPETKENVKRFLQRMIRNIDSYD